MSLKEINKKASVYSRVTAMVVMVLAAFMVNGGGITLHKVLLGVFAVLFFQLLSFIFVKEVLKSVKTWDEFDSSEEEVAYMQEKKELVSTETTVVKIATCGD